MRQLIYVPIVHSEADFGSFTHDLRKRYIDRFGLSGWRQRIRGVDALWQEIRTKVMALEIDFHKLKVYQDGLPVCGRELEIVEDLARQGSKNYQLLVELAERGAMIMGTEDAQLLVEEYLRLRDGLDADRETGILFIGLLHEVDEKLCQDMEISYPLREGEEAERINDDRRAGKR